MLNTAKWRELGRCPNCEHSAGLSSTTDEFQNVIGQIYPKQSWVSKYQNLNTFIPGLYAMSLNVAEQENEDFDEEDY